MFPFWIFSTLFFLSSCASIVTDKQDIPIRITTEPPGAIVEANANAYITPASILLPRGEGSFPLAIYKKGYHPEYVLISEIVEPLVQDKDSGLCLGCPADRLICLDCPADLSHGGGYSLTPQEINMTLRRR